MNRFNFLLLFATALFFTGCVPQETARTNTVGNGVNTNSAPSPSATTSAPVAAEPEASANVSFTLPLLDAMLTDDEFVTTVKTSIQLSDGDVAKLRELARSGVQGLSSDPAADDSRSTKTATVEARKQVEQLLGAAKANQLIALIQKSGAGEDAGTTPNTVPIDTRIVVNAPAYRMDMFREGKLVKSYKIGIGYPEFPLPTGLRKARAIIFNPTWTPPDEPWVKGKITPFEKVEAGSALNPLGPIKIPIGSPSLIHGGKSAARLGTFASHGCVGLTNAQVQDFASQLATLSGSTLSLKDVKAYEKTKTETKELKLAQDIPVELRYETIVVENGSLKIYRDVYEKGTNTQENLARVLNEFGVSLESLDATLRDKILAGLKQMASDAGDDPVAMSEQSESNANANSSIKKPKSTSDRVTKNIKGKKEVVFVIPALAGKGYPAPLGMNL